MAFAFIAGMIAFPFLVNLVSNETADLAEFLATRMVHWAARVLHGHRTPEARWHAEKWSSEVRDCPGKLTKLIPASRHGLRALAMLAARPYARVPATGRRGRPLWLPDIAIAMIITGAALGAYGLAVAGELAVITGIGTVAAGLVVTAMSYRSLRRRIAQYRHSPLMYFMEQGRPPFVCAGTGKGHAPAYMPDSGHPDLVGYGPCPYCGVKFTRGRRLTAAEVKPPPRVVIANNT
jgi:hypothetical protein